MVGSMKESVRAEDGVEPDSRSVGKQGSGQRKNTDFKDRAGVSRESETGVDGVKDVVFSDRELVDLHLRRV